MKRGYLWVDWVELGCRGWCIDEFGAGLYGLAAGQLGDSPVVDLDGSVKSDSQGDPSVRGRWDYCHMDRTTLNLTSGGSRDFMARVYNDLTAAGIFILQKRKAPQHLPQTVETSNSSTGSVFVQKWEHDGLA